MARQSPADRLKRLQRGACPIHGTDMPQIGPFDSGRPQRCLVGCPRKDCGIKGLQARPDDPVELLPEFRHLLA